MEKNQKYIIIALIATIAILAACVSYALLMPHVEYETIHISNGTTIEVPKAEDASWTKDASGIKTYSCPSKHTVMTTFNSQEDMNLIGAGAYALARDMLLNGSQDVEIYKNYQIKENTVNGTHYYMVYISSNETHDNILIGSDNLDILKHMIDSLVLGPPGEGQANATVQQSSAPAPQNNSGDDDEDDKYSEDDLMLAAEYGYYTGYSNGYSDSYYDNYYNYYDDYYSDDSVSESSSEDYEPRQVDGSLE